MRTVIMLSCLTESLVRTLYAGAVIWVLGEFAYFYMKSQAGAWTLKLTGLNREVALAIAAGCQALLGLSLLWLALLCLIIWLWTTDLKNKTEGQ